MPSKVRNRKTIQSVDERINVLVLRIRRDGNELVELHAKRRRMINGYTKTQPPPGKKNLWPRAEDLNDAADDLFPVAPGSCGPC